MKKIMLVDDSAMMRSIVKNFAGKSGLELEFIEAVNGNDAVEKFKAEKPDLVFMDIMMPEKDGIQATREIKEIDNSAKVVMCTSVKQESQEKEAAELGVSDYVKKPFSSDQIVEVIKKQLA